MGQFVALYLRISQARGLLDKIEDQEKWGREYAAATWPGVPVVAFSDNDLSAARDDVVRPEFEKLKDAIASGQVAQLWAKEQARLERKEVPWFAFAALCATCGIQFIHTMHDGIVDVSSEVAGIKAVLSAAEVRRARARIMARLQKIAEAGLPPGSRGFGYAHGVTATGERTYVLVPDQAAGLRWAGPAVLSGRSLDSAARALRDGSWSDPPVPLDGAHRMKVRNPDGSVKVDEHGKPVTRAGQITGGALKKMLTNATVAGKRVHKGVIIGPGNWEPIFDEDTWQALRAKLSAPRLVEQSNGGTYPVRPRRTSTARRYVLTGGLAVCDVCGGRLVGAKLQAAKGKPYLMCHPKGGGRGCVAIMMERTEEYIVSELFARLDSPGFLDRIVVDEHAARRAEIVVALDSIEGRRKHNAALWGGGKLTEAEWASARDALNESEWMMRRELDEKPPPPARIDIEEARSSYPFMSLGEKCAFLRLFVARIVVRKATPGLQRFDPDRITIDWIGG